MTSLRAPNPRIASHRSSQRLPRLSLAFAFLLALGAGAAAGAAPEDACRARQLQALGAFCSEAFACARSERPSGFADRCLRSAERRAKRDFRNARRKAQRRGAVCLVDRSPIAALEDLSGGIRDLSASFRVEGALRAADRRLRSSLTEAAGKHCRRLLDAEARHARRPDANRLATAQARSEARFEASFADTIARELGSGAAMPATTAGESSQEVVALARRGAPYTGAFRLSGEILAADAHFVDGDLNDPDTPRRPNDSHVEAQAIPVPSVVGGYATRAGAGPPGALRDSGDLFDVYVAELEAGQGVLLFMGEDPANADLDLCLSDAAGARVDCSVDVDELEFLRVPESGTYFIEVFAYEGASTYVLSVGGVPPIGEASRLRLRDPFVPGEILVSLEPGAAAKAGTGSGGQVAGAALDPLLGLDRVAGSPEREMLVTVGGPRAAAAKAAPGLASPGTPSDEEALRWATLREVKRLRRTPGVGRADPNHIYRARAVPDDEYYGLQWHLPLIDLPRAWDVTTGDPEEIVAVIDSGVLLAHPDLKGQLVPGYDFISDRGNSVDGDGIDPDPDDPGDGTAEVPSSFHGTHVAGTIAAATDNGEGIAGVAWGARIMPLRVLGPEGGTTYDIIQALRFATGQSNDSGTVPARTASILNLSLGGSGFSASLEAALAEARGRGALIVAAAGNEATSQPSYPAASPGVVSVAAVDLFRQRPPYSNFGPTIDIAAPGGDLRRDADGDGYLDGVLSTMGDEETGGVAFSYVFYQGTSMSAPHVAGVAALMRSIAPGLTPDRFDALLATGALSEDIGTPGRDDAFGHGLVNARDAVEAALREIGEEPPDDIPLLAANPASLNFGVARSEATLRLENAGGGALELLEVRSTAASSAWLSVDEEVVDPDTKLGRYRVRIDRSQLASGSYSGALLARSSENTLQIPVALSVGGKESSDAGRHYVLLVDLRRQRTRSVQAVEVEGGRYRFEFDKIPFGEYLVIAGSDMDNDGLVCRGAEACGAYPTADPAQPVRVDRDRAGLDFVTSFIQNIRSGDAAAVASGRGSLSAKRLPASD